MDFPDWSEYPNHRVVALSVTWDDPSTPSKDAFISHGSGVMVGHNDILTASHVVFWPGFETIDIDIQFGYPIDPVNGLPVIVPSFNGQDISGLTQEQVDSLTSGVWQAKAWPMPAGDTLTTEESAWDLALIGISDPTGDTTGWDAMRPNQESGTYTKMGFPYGKMEDYRLTADTKLVEFHNTGVYDTSNLYSHQGMSGGPLLNASNEVVGVVSTLESANRIDDEWTTLNQWMSENDFLLS